MDEGGESEEVSEDKLLDGERPSNFGAGCASESMGWVSGISIQQLNCRTRLTFRVFQSKLGSRGTRVREQSVEVSK